MSSVLHITPLVGRRWGHVMWAWLCWPSGKQRDPSCSFCSAVDEKTFVAMFERMFIQNGCSLGACRSPEDERRSSSSLIRPLASVFPFAVSISTPTPYFHQLPLKQHGAACSISLAFLANAKTQRWSQPRTIWQSRRSSRQSCVLLLLNGSSLPRVSIRTLSVYILVFPPFQFSGVIIHVMVTDCSQELDWIRSHRTSSFNWIEAPQYLGVSQWLMGRNQEHARAARAH